MLSQSLYHTWKRYRSLQSHVISALPIVILMPHSACNCRCIMCDIWKDNQNLKQLNEVDVQKLTGSLKKLGTKQVLMSGGEALLNPKFFSLCEILKKEKIKITLLSTGLTLKNNAAQIAKWVDDVIVSLDGNEEVHNRIRNIPKAFEKLKEGIEAIRRIDAGFKISGRTVIHRLNFSVWPQIIDSAAMLGLNSISFLPADVSSHAFNREVLWTPGRQEEVMLTKAELPLLEEIIDYVIDQYPGEFENRFIAESPEKIKKIGNYYKALHGLNEFPFKKCNAPWVSAVVEADGLVRPCFFHNGHGNIHEQSLEQVLNSEEAMRFRKELDMDSNETCKKCVCYLNLPPRVNPANS
jgi:Fe-coproporphyrin III synthase